MANSSYLTNIVEPFVVSWMADRLGIPLTKRRLPIAQNTAGNWVHFEFDGVSEDKSIGVLVSTSLTLKPGAVRKLHVDASVLLNAQFYRRIMVFLREDVRINFLNKCDGLLPLSRIETVVCDGISIEMWKKIEDFQQAAREEVGDRGKVWKPGGQRR